MTIPRVHSLTPRIGERPVTGDQPPHLQFSDQSPKNIFDSMANWAMVELPEQVPFVREHPTMISVPTSRALWLDETKLANQSVFMPPAGSREFAHLHADGSWHLVVSDQTVETIVDAGWGERHPWYDRGVLEVLVYAPRNPDELKIIKGLVMASIEHASNECLEELSAA